MKLTFVTLFLALCLISAAISFATRPDPSSRRRMGEQGGSGWFGPGSGFTIPGLGPVTGGYGGGWGGPSGGSSSNGMINPNITCTDQGPCYGKNLTCPAKCFSSYGSSGPGFGFGGGGGGCTIDCKDKCTAYC